MYEKLREFELRLPRTEVEEVDALRENWFELMELAEQVREVLLKERRGAFEQELDKQVKVSHFKHVYARKIFENLHFERDSWKKCSMLLNIELSSCFSG